MLQAELDPGYVLDVAKVLVCYFGMTESLRKVWEGIGIGCEISDRSSDSVAGNLDADRVHLLQCSIQRIDNCHLLAVKIHHVRTCRAKRTTDLIIPINLQQ